MHCKLKPKKMNIRSIFLFALTIFFSTSTFTQTTKTIFLSGTDAANTIDWDFFCTDGRNSGKWTKIPVPSNWELQGFGTYNYGHPAGARLHLVLLLSRGLQWRN
jgi:hypothetical protein